MRLVKEDKNLPSLDTELLIKIVSLILWLYALVPVLRIMTEDHQDLFYFVRSGFIRLATLNDYFFTSKQWKTWVFNLCINSVTIWTFGGLQPDLTLEFTNNFVVMFFPTYFCPWFSLTNSRISNNNPWQKLLKHLNIDNIQVQKNSSLIKWLF